MSQDHSTSPRAARYRSPSTSSSYESFKQLVVLPLDCPIQLGEVLGRERARWNWLRPVHAAIGRSPWLPRVLFGSAVHAPS